MYAYKISAAVTAPLLAGTIKILLNVCTVLILIWFINERFLGLIVLYFCGKYLNKQ